MKEFIIKNYIQFLKKEQIISFAKNQGITLTNQEADYIYTTIKQKNNELLKDPNPIFQESKKVLRPIVYEKMIELYDFYKKKIN